ncbi:zinc finger BED domain-containing protein RICESLEEPER 2-like [Cornus florida]|uniref:zinc finger BED domain-containing protein RICESLEEPER 2-like n=1 Tax=Cornus florida TaxID=4283 RepID=UPI0028978F6A|nr:zinc finger BED domain-containing protein RICESLEEPER 2-like [Cornus florida]
MRCSAHILNLIVNDELNNIKDSITRIREAVRWSSTFLMLEAALEVQKAFERFEEEDPHYKLELSNEPPSKSDWDDARLLAKFLQKIYDTALRLSGCLYVTSNSYFQEVIGIESLLSKWAKSSDTCLSSMAFRMQSKFDKYCWSIEKMDIMLLVALVLDPRFKMKYVKFCSGKLYPPHKVDELTHRVKEALSRVFAEYQLYDSLNSSLATLTRNSNGMAVDQPLGEAREQEHFLDSMFEKYLEEENDMDCKSESVSSSC